MVVAQVYVISGTVAQWYFTKEDLTPKRVIRSSLSNWRESGCLMVSPAPTIVAATDLFVVKLVCKVVVFSFGSISRILEEIRNRNFSFLPPVLSFDVNWLLFDWIQWIIV